MAKMVICGYKIIALRYYLIIGKLGPVLKEAISIFEKKEGFRCSGIIEDMEIRWFELLEYPPELVLINLDEPLVEVYNIIGILNTKLGIIANFIGATIALEKGIEAFKAGFVDVIIPPYIMENILLLLMRYSRIYRVTDVFCIKSYYDFQYVNLKEVVLVKAAHYVSDFILKDGSTKSNFNKLMDTHKKLPFNFQRVSKSFIINSNYVYRIVTGKKEIYLYHYPKTIRYTEKYRDSIINIKKQLSSN
jgi:hypothetical protein